MGFSLWGRSCTLQVGIRVRSPRQAISYNSTTLLTILPVDVTLVNRPRHHSCTHVHVNFPFAPFLCLHKRDNCTDMCDVAWFHLNYTAGLELVPTLMLNLALLLLCMHIAHACGPEGFKCSGAFPSRVHGYSSVTASSTLKAQTRETKIPMLSGRLTGFPNVSIRRVILPLTSLITLP